MADIPEVARYIQIEGAQARSPVSESLVQAMGGSINYLLSNATGAVSFTSSGTWTCPAGVTRVFLWGTGGGGGGGGYAASTFVGGAGGTSGRWGLLAVDVVPSTVYSVTIGAAGIGVVGASGTAGGSTTFGSLATFAGGAGGSIAVYSTVGGGFDSILYSPNGIPFLCTPVGLLVRLSHSGQPKPHQFAGGWSGTCLMSVPGYGGVNGVTAESGQSSFNFSGGTGGASFLGFAPGGGGGGASVWGSGGNGASYTGGNGTSVLSTAYGAGGGGAGGSGVTAYKGGDGGPGFLQVLW
jgi:hypothetical protein